MTYLVIDKFVPVDTAGVVVNMALGRNDVVAVRSDPEVRRVYLGEADDAAA